MVRFALLLSLAASVSAKTTLRRMLSGNSDMMSNALAAGGAEDDDYTCTMFFPEDAGSCEALVDASGNPCVWCPVGDIFGACVSGEQAAIVNEAEVPHVTCGKSPSDEDIEFWGTLEKCDIGGDTEKDCLTTDGPCTWCKVDQEGLGIPKFGLCFSTEYYDVLLEQDESGMLKMLMQCTTDSTDTSLQVGSLTDMKCILEGNPDPDDTMGEETASLCGKALDAEGRKCEVVSVMGFLDFCMSETQAGLFNLVMAQADDMGVLDQIGGPDEGDDLVYYPSTEEEEPEPAEITEPEMPAPELDNKEPSSASELLAKYVQKEEVKDELDSETGN